MRHDPWVYSKLNETPLARERFIGNRLCKQLRLIPDTNPPLAFQIQIFCDGRWVSDRQWSAEAFSDCLLLLDGLTSFDDQCIVRIVDKHGSVPFAAFGRQIVFVRVLGRHHVDAILRPANR